jgi:hypothetical protein
MEYQRLSQTVDGLLTADPNTRAYMIKVNRPFWNDVLRLYGSLRLARLCAFLRERKPDDNIGYSILIYRLTARDIHEALYGYWWQTFTGFKRGSNGDAVSGLSSSSGRISFETKLYGGQGPVRRMSIPSSFLGGF